MGVLTLTGGQYGSEGKGVIAAKIAPYIDVSVRTGGPNAGHSLIHEGKIWKMRSVPCAWVNPHAELIIGAGAIIDPEVLIEEVAELEVAGYRIKNRLYVDHRATVIRPSDREDESGALRLNRIGSTLEGVGSARMRRIARDSDDWTTVAEALAGTGIQISDTVTLLRDHDTIGSRIVLEGTQGAGLSLTFGQWPYVTSANCHAAQLVADAGLPPMNTYNLTVFRSFPIRVGGTSGPLKGEKEWTDFPGVTPERTTVTKKIRRIGEWDWDLAKEAVLLNAPIALVLTFADYIDPAVAGVTEWEKLTKPVRHFIDKIERRLGVRVDFIGTGGPEWSIVDRYAALSDNRDSRIREDDHIVILGRVF